MAIEEGAGSFCHEREVEDAVKAALKTYDRWVPPVIEREGNGQLVCVRDMWGQGVSELRAQRSADG